MRQRPALLDWRGSEVVQRTHVPDDISGESGPQRDHRGHESRIGKPSRTLLPDEKSQVQNLAPCRERWRKPRNTGVLVQSFSSVPGCSRHAGPQMDRSDGRKRPQATRCAASRRGVQELELGVGPRACSVPSVPTLVKIAATTGVEFAFDVVPAGREPTLVRKPSRTRRLMCTPAARSLQLADSVVCQLAPVSSRPEIRRATER